MLKLRTAFFFSLCLLLFTACASAPKIHSTSEPGVDFSAYKTYQFLDSHNPQGQEYSTINDKLIKESIARELAKRGITPAEDPDLWISYKTNTKEKITSRNVGVNPSMYYGYRGYYGYSVGANFGTQTEVRQYTEGTLNIDVVDKNRKQLIWEGVAVGRLKDKAPEDLEGTISNTVRAIFTEYPIRPNSLK